MKKQATLAVVCLCATALLFSCKKGAEQNPESRDEVNTIASKSSQGSNVVPNIVIDSACKKKKYLFYLDPLTHTFFDTLYFHFCDPVTGNVVAIRKNASITNPRTVFAPAGLTSWKVVAATDSLISLTYSGDCSYSSFVPEEAGSSPSISNLVCNITKCDGGIDTEQ